jgi:hypothetical protein
MKAYKDILDLLKQTAKIKIFCDMQKDLRKIDCKIILNGKPF